jgi:hypothetical protein
MASLSFDQCLALLCTFMSDESHEMENLQESKMRHQYRYPSQKTKNSHQIDATLVGIRKFLYKYLNTVAEDLTAFIYAVRQKAAETPRETNGTPRLSVFARIEGADPPSARPYNVLDAI